MRLGIIFMWQGPNFLTQIIRITPLNCSFKRRDSTEGHDYWKYWIAGELPGDTITKDNTQMKQKCIIPIY